MKINSQKHVTKDGNIKSNPRSLSVDDKYFRDYFRESTKVNGYEEFVERGSDVYEYNYTKDDIVKILQSLDPSTKRKIRDMMVRIDFANGNMQNYIDFLMKGYTAMNRGERI